uniref:Uncharacterized protein n=1 Tax=Anguilla anguilla TaxID=7936 RepID=A0A0E9TVL1_ANGAN
MHGHPSKISASTSPSSSLLPVRLQKHILPHILIRNASQT